MAVGNAERAVSADGRSRLESGRQNSRLWPQDNDGKVHRADVERAVEEHKLGGVRARITPQPWRET